MKISARSSRALFASVCVVALAGVLAACRSGSHTNQAAFTPATLAASPVSPRKYFGRRLEPRDNVVLHGAGQTDTASFLAYSKAVAPQTPMLFMSYVDLKADLPAYFAQLKVQLEALPQFAIPQIGLSLNGGDPKLHYESAVASGALDTQLQQLCAGLRSLDRPVFVRPGYEFNGAWNGYEAKPYVVAFQRIVKTTRDCGLQNVAFVWDWSVTANTATHSGHSWTAFYPGDAWVDWWGLNLFPAAELTSASTQAFLADAEAHRFPVMIAESSAQHQDLRAGQHAVDAWFAPYFGLIRRSAVIKAFCYIDWDWRRYPQWADWGDARIEGNSTVLAFYRKQLESPLLAGARDRNATLQLLREK